MKTYCSVDESYENGVCVLCGETGAHESLPTESGLLCDDCAEDNGCACGCFPSVHGEFEWVPQSAYGEFEIDHTTRDTITFKRRLHTYDRLYIDGEPTVHTNMDDRN